MKKTIIIVACALVVIGLGIGGYFMGWYSPMGFAPETGEEPQYIGVEAAKDIALLDSGVAAGDIGRIRAAFEKEDGSAYYEVEFNAGDREYSYDIAAKTGNILDIDRDSIYD